MGISIVKQIKRFLYTKESLVFFLALLARFSVFAFLWWWFRTTGHMPEPPFRFPVLGGDSSDYFTLSENLRHNGVFSLSSGAPFVPESFRLPGYPFFLYLFTYLPGTYVTATIAQMILGAGSCVLLFRLGKKFFSEQGAFIAALLFCIEPTSLLFSAVLMSDTIFVFAMLLALYLLFTRARSAPASLLLGAAAGALFGYAILVRVIAEFLIPCVILGYLFIFRKELRPYGASAAKLCAVALFAALAVLPWALREHYWFDTYTLSSTQYINFTQYNLVYFYAYEHDISTQEAQHVYSDKIPYGQGSPWFNSLVNEPIFQEEMREGLSNGQLIPYMKFHLIKTLPFFLNDSLRDINRMIGIFPEPPEQTNFTDLLIKKDAAGVLSYLKTPQPDLYMLLIGSLAWALISALGIGFALYSALARKKNAWFVLFCLGVVLYFGILSSPVIQPRYRMPAAPFMLLLAAEALVTVKAKINARAGRL